MDCKICNPQTADENICMLCEQELSPYVRAFSDISGYTLPNTFLLYLNDFAGNPQSFLKGCFVGGRVPFWVFRDQVVRQLLPKYDYYLTSDKRNGGN